MLFINDFVLCQFIVTFNNITVYYVTFIDTVTSAFTFTLTINLMLLLIYSDCYANVMSFCDCYFTVTATLPLLIFTVTLCSGTEGSESPVPSVYLKLDHQLQVRSHHWVFLKGPELQITIHMFSLLYTLVKCNQMSHLLVHQRLINKNSSWILSLHRLLVVFLSLLFLSPAFGSLSKLPGVHDCV